MKILVIASAKNGQINANLVNVLTAASKIYAKCDVLVIGSADLTALSNLSCVGKYCISTPSLMNKI